MQASKKFPAKKTWIEINKSAVAHNVEAFRGLLSARTKLWAVVKSNAYGHGLFLFSKLLALRSPSGLRSRNYFGGVDGEGGGVDGFCVDSVIEGAKLRESGIKKFILVLGPTLSPELVSQAASHDIAITISTFEGLSMEEKAKSMPRFHIKIDTGMHRQGVERTAISEVVGHLKKNTRLESALEGVYTHFATATDAKNTKTVKRQAQEFRSAVREFRVAGITRFCTHAAATGAVLLGTQYHFDAVRVGLGLYGLYPTQALAEQYPRLGLTPVFSWRTVISEIKDLLPGECVGYDHTACASKRTTIAILPIGYWHGFPRSLSNRGSVLVRGKYAPVFGRVSMDLTVVDVTGIPCKVGDPVTLIGKEGSKRISAEKIAEDAESAHYEILTRTNPLIERVLT